MVNTKQYSQAVTEVIDILQNADSEIIEKIPLELIKNLNAKKDLDYIPNIEYTENGISNIKPETKAILAVIYRNYLCTEEEKEELQNKVKENQKVFNEKYSINFYSKEYINDSNTLPSVIEDGFWKKIINKIFGGKK